MDRSNWFEPKWCWLKRFALAAIPGIALIIAGAIVELALLIALGAFLIVPLLFWVVFIPVMHWKDRYIGESSGAWGASLAFETSGWSKLVYWFRHVLPDWRRTGRYSAAP